MTDTRDTPVYAIGIAAKLCGVHPQTLRSYERQGLINPARENEKNRIYSESDIERVRRIQRLTQDMGVNLAGVEIILRLIDQLEESRTDMEAQMQEFIRETESRLAVLLQNASVPMRQDDDLLPVPKIKIRGKVDV